LLSERKPLIKSFKGTVPIIGDDREENQRIQAVIIANPRRVSILVCPNSLYKNLRVNWDCPDYPYILNK
jgi:hypothetical protein